MISKNELSPPRSGGESSFLEIFVSDNSKALYAASKHAPAIVPVCQRHQWPPLPGPTFSLVVPVHNEGRVYDEIKGRPLYLVARRWGR
jgi:hypothetical protein